MSPERRPILVLGDGGWGTALAMVLAVGGRPVRVWSCDPKYADEVEERRENRKFLPGVPIPAGIRFGADIEELADGADTVFSVVPTQFLRSSLEALAPALEAALPPGALCVSCSKGFERQTLALPSSLVSHFLPGRRLVILSGPSHAEEVSRRLPTTVVVAARRADDALEAQSLVTTPFFRAYTSSDPLGVEIAGAAKNVIALGAGICDGLGLGDNSRAGLICRGASGMTRLGAAFGARRETFAGLAGMGDLIATCTSTHSRNHTVGHRIGRGESLDDILGSMEKVAEGVETTRSMHQLAAQKKVELPITAAVYSVLFENTPPRRAVEELMSREPKEE